MRQLLFLIIACFSLSVSGSVSAQSCREYFASEWGEVLDMSETTDINNSFPGGERNDLSSYSFSQGIFSTTATGPDPWFRVLTRAINGSIADKTTRFGDHHPINPSTYQQLIIRMNTDRASALQVFWDQADRSVVGSAPVSTTPGWRTYTVDLNTGPWSNGFNFGIRIDPTTEPGARIEIDYIQLTPYGCTNPDLRTAPILQPDREGGEDHYASVRGNPINLDALNDLEYIQGHSSASLYTSKVYQDSFNLFRRQDYFQATNDPSNWDPQLFFTFPGTLYRIDASRFKIACWTLDVLRPVNEFHSVMRLIWQQSFGTSSIYYGTDDLVTKWTGEERYCLRLDSVALEPPLAPGMPHPWKNNDDGTGIDYLRLDPHEEDAPTTYRLIDARLAADHEAHTRFTIVVGGDRSAPVTVEYQRGNEARAAIATLTQNRNSDVVVWNTESLAEGLYYIYTTIGLNTYRSEAPIVVSHTAKAHDVFPPALHVDSPLAGHRFNNTLQIAGYAADTRRIATVEVHIDGVLVDSFVPSNFDARARDLFPSVPYNSNAGFDRFLDTTNLNPGAHALTVTVWDTGGNSTVHSTTITKATTNLTSNFVAPYQEAQPIPVQNGLQPRPRPETPAPTPQPTTPPSLGKAQLNLRISNDRLSMYAVGVNCSLVRLYVSGYRKESDIKNRGTLLHSVSGNKLRGLSSKIPSMRTNKNIYFLADCGDGSRATIKSINARNFRSRQRTTSGSRVLSAIVKNFRVSR